MANRMNRKNTRANRKSRMNRKSRKSTRRMQRKSRRMNRRFFGGFFQTYGTATGTQGGIPPSAAIASSTMAAPPPAKDISAPSESNKMQGRIVTTSKTVAKK